MAGWLAGLARWGWGWAGGGSLAQCTWKWWGGVIVSYSRKNFIDVEAYMAWFSRMSGLLSTVVLVLALLTGKRVLQRVGRCV